MAESRRGIAAFVAVAAGCLAIGAGYLAWAASSVPRATPSPAIGAGSSLVPASPDPTDGAPGRLVFQHVVRDDDYAHVALATLDDPDGSRTILPMTCERVHMDAGRGLCLVPEFGLLTTFHAQVFDGDFRETASIELGGPPSRARVSPDGRLGASTVFVFGHSYADAFFSTSTLIIDLAAGASLGDLETWTAVDRDGREITAPDRNFWGVTFAADPDRFYATLRTGGRTYLVQGDVATRRMQVIADDVECPSLSPDGTRIAYKRVVATGPVWQLHVMDLATLASIPLAEVRSVDDQAEWLDDSTVLYGLGEDVWRVPADGTGAPERYIAGGLSPAVVRTTVTAGAPGPSG